MIFVMATAPRTDRTFKIKNTGYTFKTIISVMTWLKIRIRRFKEHCKRTKKCRTKKGVAGRKNVMPNAEQLILWRFFCGRTKKRVVCFPSLLLLDVYTNLFYMITSTPRKYSILKLISK